MELLIGLPTQHKQDIIRVMEVPSTSSISCQQLLPFMVYDTPLAYWYFMLFMLVFPCLYEMHRIHRTHKTRCGVGDRSIPQYNKELDREVLFTGFTCVSKVMRQRQSHVATNPLAFV